jgi:predicted nuclease of predicted toxin-antitoxin system
MLATLVADGLREAGHDATHVGDVGLLGATDEQVMSLALEQSRIVVSADTDFGELLARNRLGMPSVILLRRNHDPEDQVRTILNALVDIADDLITGAIVVIVEDRLRIRRLPIR